MCIPWLLMPKVLKCRMSWLMKPCFLLWKKDLITLLGKQDISIDYFGYAPDYTADEQDELLTEGVFFRIIGYEKNLVLI